MDWKIRQAAVHHQLDVETGGQFWAIVDPFHAIKERVTKMLPHSERHERFNTFVDSFRTSLDIHLDFGWWSVENLRIFIQDLEKAIENGVSHTF
jgi:hypothetical protein